MNVCDYFFLLFFVQDFMVSLAYETYANFIDKDDENGLRELLEGKSLAVDETSEVSDPFYQSIINYQSEQS